MIVNTFYAQTPPRDLTARIGFLVVARFIGLKPPHEWGNYTNPRRSAFVLSF
jgi:hypothetical protein